MMHFAGITYERYSTFCRFLDGNNVMVMVLLIFLESDADHRKQTML